MILFNPTPLVPKPLRWRFFALRGLLLVTFFGLGGVFAYSAVFPSQYFLFSFENPDTAKNTFEEPAGKDGKSLKKGRIEGGNSLRTYAGTVGSFSSVHVSLVLEDDSPVPDEPLEVSLRRSYRAFFAPDGEPITTLPKERVFTIGNTAYLFTDEKLFPFISSRAALSHAPEEKMFPANEDLLRIFPLQEDYAGFRTGSLLSDAEGVYAIGGDRKAHPIGSVAVFESLGFDWDGVIRADEEELGLHKRGKIFLFDAMQPDGTLFLDTDTGRYHLIENGLRRAVESKDYLASLLAVTTPIEASGEALGRSVSCSPVKRTFAFRPTYECDIPIEALRDHPGGSFELTLDTDATIHAAELTATFEVKPSRENFSMFMSQVRDRFDAVYGGQ